jgi:hypothetical protein
VGRGLDLPVNEELLDDIYGLQRGFQVEAWSSFISQMAAERSLELAFLNFPEGAARRSWIEKIAGAAGACRKPSSADVRSLAAKLEGAVSPVTDAWLGGMAAAARCMAADMDRWSRLRQEMGLDIEMVSTLLTHEDLETLPAGVRHLAKGISGLPIFRHLLLEMPQLTGLNESATRTCGYIQEQVDAHTPVSGVVGLEIPRRTYCRAAFSELTLLTYEINGLYSSYPMLAERAKDGSGKPLFESLTELQGGASGARAPTSSDPASCMESLATQGIAPLAPELRARIAAAAVPKVAQQMEPLLGQIRAACDPEHQDELISMAFDRPELVERFYSCTRPRFLSLRAFSTSKVGERDAGPLYTDALPAGDCAERMDSTWIGCRLFDEYRRRDELKSAASMTLQMGMDALTFITPIEGLTGALSARAIGTGATIGGGLGYAFAPSLEEASLSHQFEASQFISGAGSFQQYESAIEALGSLVKRDPRWEAAFTGAANGALFAAIAGDQALAERSARKLARLDAGRKVAALVETNPSLWSAEMDLQLVSAYRALERAGAFADEAGAAVKSKLDDLFEARLAEKYPRVARDGWQRLEMPEKLQVLEGHVDPPRVRGPPRAVADLELEGAPAATVLTEAQTAFVSANRQLPAAARLPTTLENRAFIALAESASNPVKGAALRFFEVENSVLKALNDKVFRSKDVVDAVENRWRALLLAEIDGNPVLRAAMKARYQDFKSMRFAFSASPELEAAFDSAFSRATRAFNEELKAGPFADSFQGLDGKYGDPTRWHMAAVGNTVDEAGAAARYARAIDMPGGVMLQSIEDSSEWLRAQAIHAEQMREIFVRNLDSGASNALLRKVDGVFSSPVPSEAVFELVRKADFSDPQAGLLELGARIKKRFGVQLSETQLKQLREYTQAVDSFSVGLLIPERVSNDLSVAASGIVSADFAGQGGRNLVETAAALARTSKAVRGGNISTVISEARIAEQRATELMRTLNDDFKEALARTVGRDAVKRLTFSGDDGIFLPDAEWTHAERLKLASHLAEVSATPANFRLTWVPSEFLTGESIPTALRSRMVFMAEAVEKTVRSGLEGRIPREQLNGTVMLVEFVPEGTGGGTFRVILSAKEQSLFGNAARREAILQAAQQELEKAVLDAARKDPGLSFKAGGVDFIRAGAPAPVKKGGFLWPEPSLPHGVDSFVSSWFGKKCLWIPTLAPG